MRLAILGAGAIGLTTAAIVASRGHEAVLWSPSGKSTEGMSNSTFVKSTGALAGQWPVSIAQKIEDALADADAVLLAVDANGHRSVMEIAASHLREGIPFIISAAHSLSGLYLARLIQARNVELPIISFNTSTGTSHRHENGVVDIRTVRSTIEYSVTATREYPHLEKFCADLFPASFNRQPNAVAIALLANCNPVFHVPVCLLNVTRIEHGETWAPYGQTTASVGRLMEALDHERLAIATAYGINIHSVNEHFHRSFKIPIESMGVMNGMLHAKGRGPQGPKSIHHRYLMQDIPYGLVFASEIAKIAGLPVPVHDATILLAGAMLDVNMSTQNNLLSVLGLEKLTRDELLSFATVARHPQDVNQ